MPEWSYPSDVVLIEALTQREMEVLSLLASGQSSRGIARGMTLAVSTVNWYLQQIYTKLGVNSRQDAVQRAQELGLLGEGSDRLQATLKPDTTPRHNLPLQLTSFIGREKEITEVKRLLGGTRLLTLSGVGGSGKTRLATMVASQVLNEYEHGIWLVDLAPLHDPGLIPSAVASVFNLGQDAGQPVQEALNNYLRSKRLLLILDNCEHLIQEAARFAETVLRLAPEVKILATSRETLGLAGEMVYQVPPLETPDPHHLPPIQTLVQFDAVWLFTERASAALPTFTLSELNGPAVAQICNQLDGIPLAIELAAARMKILSAERIASRLDDRFRLLTGGSRTAYPRHQTLHALIDWSHDLLSEPERVLFRRLSVFRGGWTLEAAEALCPCGCQVEFEVLEVLGELVNKSLVDVEIHAGEAGRYRMLETIRQYAQEKLRESGEVAAMLDRHLEYYVNFAEAMEVKLHTPAYPEAFEQFDAEIDNHRLALDWALGRGKEGRIELGLRLATALDYYWFYRSLFQEGYDWLSKGLAVSEGMQGLDRLRARTYLALGNNYVSTMADFHKFRQQSVELYRKTDDKLWLAYALVSFGTLLSDTMPASPRPIDLPAGIALLQEAIGILEALGDPHSLGKAFNARALIANAQKDYTAEGKLLEKSLAYFQESGDVLDKEIATVTLAYYASQRGDYETSRKLNEQALEFYRAVGSWHLQAMTLARMGEQAYRQGDYARSETAFKQALAIFQDSVVMDGTVWVTRMLGCVAFHFGQVAHARQLFLQSQSLGARLFYRDQPGDPGGDLSFVVWSAVIGESLGQPVLAARLLGAVEAILETFFKPLDTWDAKEYELLTGKLRTTLDEATLKSAWTAGRALTLDQAVAEALALKIE